MHRSKNFNWCLVSKLSVCCLDHILMLFQAVFEANVAAMHGGGLYLDNGAALTVRGGMGDRFSGEGQWQ